MHIIRHPTRFVLLGQFLSPLSNIVAAKRGDILKAAERRKAIMRILCRRRHDTIKNLAFEFEVSERTIRRDIEILSYTEPIYTQRGRYEGGVHIVDGYYFDRMYMSKEEIGVLEKLHTYAKEQKKCSLSSQELNILRQMIQLYTKPSHK